MISAGTTEGSGRMILSCEKEKLNGCVQTALRAVSTRVTMPILSGILINGEAGRLMISATDLEMSIRSEADAKVRESGSTVVSGRLLGDITKNLPAGEVSCLLYTSPSPRD